MKLLRLLQISILFVSVTFIQISKAEVISADKSHFRLELVAETTLSPEQVWKKLINPQKWWHSDHKYSGDSANLTLELKAGRFWREKWEGGSVLHGTVLNIQPNKLLRLSAPFEPLQEMAVETLWTIVLTPAKTGTTIKFDFIASGSASSGLDKLAAAVNYVKGEALKNLAKSN